MAKKFSPRDVLVPTVALFLIASVCTAILAFTNSVTKDKIEANARETEMNSRMLVCPDASTFSDDKTVSVDGTEHSYNEALDSDGNVIGYVFTSESKGYGGAVVVMTGFNTNGEVTGVETLELSETAGLGMNAKKESFRDQYKEKVGLFVVNKDNNTSTADRNEIQALTGATITSRAVTNAVNSAVEMYNEVAGGGNNG